MQDKVESCQDPSRHPSLILDLFFVVVNRSVVSNSGTPWTGSSVHGILQIRILEWVAMPFSRGSSPPRDRTWDSRIAGRFFTV